MRAYNELPDKELFLLFQTEEPAAFTEIYRRYHSLLYIYAHKKLNNKEEAQDVVQEVLTALWRSRATCSLEGSLASYLYSAVRNKAFDIFAKRKLEARYVESLASFLAAAGDSCDFRVREADLRSLIEKEVKALPAKMQEVFRLSREQTLSHREIAEVLGISEQTVSTQIKKALRVLRLRLGSLFSLLIAAAAQY